MQPMVCAEIVGGALRKAALGSLSPESLQQIACWCLEALPLSGQQGRQTSRLLTRQL